MLFTRMSADGRAHVLLLSTLAPPGAVQWENQVVEDLQSLSCVPRHYLFGKHGNKDVLVMELLSGEDMSALRCVRCRCRR